MQAVGFCEKGLLIKSFVGVSFLFFCKFTEKFEKGIDTVGRMWYN